MARTRGRPPRGDLSHLIVWALIELSRDRQQPDLPRLSLRQASERLGPAFGCSDRQVRRVHAAAERILLEEALDEGVSLEALRARLLSAFRKYRRETGWSRWDVFLPQIINVPKSE
jgi:hypothetical protein